MNMFDKIKQFLSDIFCSFYSEARTIVRDEGVVLFMLFIKTKFGRHVFAIGSNEASNR